jgi:hypothetical protein
MNPVGIRSATLSLVRDALKLVRGFPPDYLNPATGRPFAKDLRDSLFDEVRTFSRENRPFSLLAAQQALLQGENQLEQVRELLVSKVKGVPLAERDDPGVRHGGERG